MTNIFDEFQAGQFQLIAFKLLKSSLLTVINETATKTTKITVDYRSRRNFQQYLHIQSFTH